MNRWKPFLPVAVFLGATLAGCIAGSSTDTGPPPADANGPATFDENTGGVDGMVTDAELVPVVGAVVGLLHDDTIPSDVSVTTDETGHFAMSRVAPGDHALAGSAV